MDAIDHLPGCDARHGRRIRCNGQPEPVKPEAADGAVAQRDGTPDGTRSARAALIGHRRSVPLPLAWFAASLVALVASVLVVFDPFGLIGDDGHTPPRLPGFAYPVRATLVDERVHCPEPASCYRQLRFISRESAESTLAVLEQALNNEDWIVSGRTIDQQRGTFSLVTGSVRDRTCVAYRAVPPQEFGDDPTSKLEIDVDIGICNSSP